MSIIYGCLVNVQVMAGALSLTVLALPMLNFCCVDVPKINAANMPPQPQPAPSNMKPCTACEEDRWSHIPSGTGKRCSSKMQLSPQADLWCT